MTRVKGTALAIAFAPDQRTNIENDLAIAYSIASRLKGSFHPRSNAAICIFPSITDCLQSATAAVNWFARTEGGLNGVGIGIDEDGDPEALMPLAMRGLSSGSHDVFLTDTIYFLQVRDFPGVEFQKIVETVLPGRKGSNWIYGMTVQLGGLADVVDATLSDDTAGWDAVPLPTHDGAEAADGDATVMGLELPLPAAGCAVSPAADDGDDDATLINAPIFQNRAAATTQEVSDLRAGIELMEQCSISARQFISIGKPYSAIYEIDLVLANDIVQNPVGIEGPRETLRAMRDECLAGVGILTGLIISGESEILSIHRGDSLMIGRDPDDGTPGLKLGNQTMSRIPRQLRIDRRGQDYVITDLGSANGSFLDDTQLVANQGTPLDRLEEGMTLSLGGVLNPPEKGKCRLHLSTMGETTANLLIRVAIGHLTQTSRVQLRANWPDMDRDCARHWVYAEAPILIGSGDNCGLRLASAPNTGPVARIEWTDNGYTLAPMADQIMLDGAPVLGPVVIADGVRLELLGQSFQIEENGG
jgi:hypothetical protein